MVYIPSMQVENLFLNHLWYLLPSDFFLIYIILHFLCLATRCVDVQNFIYFQWSFLSRQSPWRIYAKCEDVSGPVGFLQARPSICSKTEWNMLWAHLAAVENVLGNKCLAVRLKTAVNRASHAHGNHTTVNNQIYIIVWRKHLHGLQ